MIDWILFFACAIAVFMFSRRGKNYGYRVLESRTNQLLAQGIDEVWLVRNLYDDFFRRLSIWSLVSPGSLAYVVNQKLVIEAPWWKQIHLFLSEPTYQVGLELSWITLAPLHAQKTVRIHDQSYIIVGKNIRDVLDIKQRLSLKNRAANDRLLQDFVKTIQLPPASTNIGTTSFMLQPSPIYKTTFWNGIRGAILYVLIPSVILAAIFILIAWLTKQPVFSS